MEYKAQLCLMNMAVHGLTGVIKSGDEANSFYHDAHNLAGCCDYVMANPPFNVDKVKSEACERAGRLPFGLPAVNKQKEVGNANYLWISYFYAYLNETGRAGFVMASSATDSQSKDKDIRRALVETGHVDVMVSVGNNFFYTKSLPCSLWFFDKGKEVARLDKVLFIDARNYYTVVDRTLNEWTDWQLKNLNAIVWLYRGERYQYSCLMEDYEYHLSMCAIDLKDSQLISMIKTMQKVIDWEQIQTEKRDQIQQLFDSITEGMNGLHWDELEKGHKQYSRFEKLKSAISKFEPLAIEALDAIKDGRFFSYYTYKDQEYPANPRKNASKASKKKIMATVIRNKCHTALSEIDETINILKEYFWLTDKFGENGEYLDIPGLCKVAERSEI